MKNKLIKNNEKLERKLDKKAVKFVRTILENYAEKMISLGYYSGYFSKDTIEYELNISITQNMFNLGIIAYNRKHHFLYYLINRLLDLKECLLKKIKKPFKKRKLNLESE